MSTCEHRVRGDPPALKLANVYAGMATSRLPLLDTLRGCALLGILLMNIEAYVGPLNAGLTGLNPALTGSDRWLDGLIYVCVQGKFYTIFSLLFGASFALMQGKAQREQRRFVPFYLRRMSVLGLFGLIHAILIWSGDILFTYAVWGSALLLVRRVPTALLPYMAVVLYFIVPLTLIIYACLVAVTLHQPSQVAVWRQIHDQTVHQVAAALQAQRHALEHATFAQACRQRLDDFIATCNGLIANGLAIFAFFLFGRWLVETGVLLDVSRWQRLGERLRWIVWPVGLGCMLLSFAIQPTMEAQSLTVSMAFAYFLAQVANMLMCFGYIAWFACLAQRTAHSFASAGRMSLSLYLMQSLICTWLFSGYGLGLYPYVSRTWQIPFAIMLFALQWRLSQWWLQRYRYGPVEWLWRCASDVRWQPWRRSFER